MMTLQKCIAVQFLKVLCDTGAHLFQSKEKCQNNSRFKKNLNLKLLLNIRGILWDHLMTFDLLTTFNCNPTNGDEALNVTLELHSVMSQLICSGMVTDGQPYRGNISSDLLICI